MKLELEPNLEKGTFLNQTLIPLVVSPLTGPCSFPLTNSPSRVQSTFSKDTLPFPDKCPPRLETILGININFPCMFLNPNIFSDMNFNCLLDIKNLKEQVKETILLPKTVLTFHLRSFK